MDDSWTWTTVWGMMGAGAVLGRGGKRQKNWDNCDKQE